MDRQTIFNQLKWAIQALSLESESQIASFPDFVVVTDELLLEFDNWYKISTGNYRDTFSDDQIEILKKIDLFIGSIPAEDVNMSIEEELKSSFFWRELRIIAREALIKFNWNSEIPPNDRTTYICG